MPLNQKNQSMDASKNRYPQQPDGCNWFCDLTCQFGYKIDQRTKCYKCECLELNMTECGVPCYIPGTKSCIFSNRANSRPLCVCEDHFDGVYCHTCKSLINFYLSSYFIIKILSD